MKTWGRKDVVAATNADWSETLVLGIEGQPLVLEGATLSMMIRRRPGSVDPHMVLSTGDGLTLIDPVARTMAVQVESDQMAELGPGGFVYDVLVTNGGVITRALEGALTVILGTTRP